MSNDIVQADLFNYSAIDADTSAYLRQNAQETRGLLKRTTEDIIQIGKNLLDAKARLPHGQFIPWVKAELGISQSTSWRFMQVAQGKQIGKSVTVNEVLAQIAAPEQKQDASDNEETPQEGTVSNVPIDKIIPADQFDLDACREVIPIRMYINIQNTKHPFHHKTCLGAIVDADPTLAYLIGRLPTYEQFYWWHRINQWESDPDAPATIPCKLDYYGFAIYSEEKTK